MPPCRVLVVDDDPATCNLLDLALGAEGYEVRTVQDGRRALAVLAHWRPHLIILDLLVRNLDGWDFRAEQRRGPHADVPVLVLTAIQHPDRYAEALAAPIMSKPFNLDDLLATVARLVGRDPA